MDVSGEPQIVREGEWEALKKRINGLVKQATASNVREVADQLLSQDLIWGRGLFCSAILNNSSSSSGPVFAALVAAVNSFFPDVGYLLLKRIVNQFKIAFYEQGKGKGQDNFKITLLPLVKLLAHLANQEVVSELVPLQILHLLLQYPTKDSLQVAVVLIQQCCYAVSPRGIDSVFERLQEILGAAAGDLDVQIACLIEELLSAMMTKSRFSPELDIVEVDDQVTHEISLLDEVDPEMFLDLFRKTKTSLKKDELML